ncbi:SET domain-containing protein RMS1 [Aureobasidium pullulans]|uniref:Ribosomal lysine N-methyltransferase 4 n=1 Tax=Aureobasidium pullulans TaxID=5580 RepID=A0A4S8Z5W1_AURPU|nr:SET domain-containing protein RMS1 [Aureobasidium pullulans]
MADFQAKSDVFLNWFKSQSGATYDSRLQLTDLRDRGAGRGIIATSDIPAETDLFIIPRKSVISVENSELSKKLPRIFTGLKNLDADGDDGMADGDDEEESLSMPDPWLDLIMVMVYEYLQGDNSAWKTYFEVLPNSFDTLMFWGQSELNELQASAVKDKVGKESADEMFETKVLPVVKAHEDVFYSAGAQKLSDEQIVELAHRMGSIIMAYAFDLENNEEDEDDEQEGWVQDLEGTQAMGMVPMADMLNADAEFNAHLNHGEDTLTMTSLREIKAGEEVLNYYGPLPNCDLLRRYGYTSAKHSRYDVVEVPWEIISSTIDKRFTGKKGALDEDELEEGFVLERDSGEPDDTGINTHPAKFVGFPEELEEQVCQVIAPAMGISLDKGPNKVQRRQLKHTFFEIMDAVVPARLSQYGTTVEQDEQLLKNTDLEGRHRMAVSVRLGEKQLLKEAGAFIPAQLEKYKPVQEEEEGRSAKRQKR